MIKKAIGLSSFIIAFSCAAFADEATLSTQAVSAISIAGNAGAATSTPVNAVGGTLYLRSRDFASSAVRGNLGYMRFDLSGLSSPSIQSATLQLTRVAGDSLTTGRVAIFGLRDRPGNAPQNWNTSSFPPGEEFDISMFQDFVANPGASPVNLDAVVNLSADETISGNNIILNSQAFVEFLQSRADDDGLATLLIAMPSQGGTTDRNFSLATHNNTDPATHPSLRIVYFDSSLPSPPQNLAASDIEYTLEPRITLSWTPVQDAITYHVFRRAEGEAEPVEIGIAGINAYVDTDVELLGRYAYSVAVKTSSGESIRSPEIDIIVIDISTPEPSIPFDITLASANPSQINLLWQSSSDTLAYEVFRSTKPDREFAFLGLSTENAFADSLDLVGYQTYFYLVNAIGAGGRSAYSAPFEVGPRFSQGPRASRPRSLSLVERENHRIRLSWPASNNADAYHLFRSTNPQKDFKRVDVFTSPEATDDYAIYPDQTYYYYVQAIGVGGLSLPSWPLTVQPNITEHRQMERLTRAPVAIQTENGVYLGWRYLGTDSNDTAFNIYRDGQRLNRRPIRGSTNLLDPEGNASSSYEVRPVFAGHEAKTGESFSVWSSNYLALPIQAPQGGTTPDGVAYSYSANDASVADLDGDGEYEIVLKWDPSNSKDNANSGFTGNVFIDAYKLDGTLLWRIDLGRNIRAGAHYTQFMVYDLDGDGIAEMICKTADGSIDGLGTVIGDPDADHRNPNGYILLGDEFLTAFDGRDGSIIDTAPFSPQRGNVADWGDTFGNRVDRFLAGIAYFDGVNPSFFSARGQYRGQNNTDGRTVIAAWDLVDRKLAQRWVLDSFQDGREWAGQGHHQLSVGDVDGDGRDEILYGGMVVDDDGKGLYSTLLGTGDALHFGDFDPTRPGLEFFAVKEGASSPVQVEYRDPATGQLIWGVFNARDTGRGLTADIDPYFPGAEVWGAANLNVWNAQGDVIGTRRPSINFATWWDGDLLRELTDSNSIRKWDWVNEVEVPIMVATGALSNNGSKATPSLQADLFGDWREEVIFRSDDSSELRIYSTSDLTDRRITTLMHDPIYRLSVAWQNSSYNQPPHPSFFIGQNMPAPSRPRIFVKPIPRISGTMQQDRNTYTSNVEVALEVNQNSDLKNQYRLNAGTWKRYHHPLKLAANGQHQIEFRTLDQNDQVLDASSLTLDIEKPTPPAECAIDQKEKNKPRFLLTLLERWKR